MPTPVIFLALANDHTHTDRFLPELEQELTGIKAQLQPAIDQGLCELVVEPDATIDEILAIFQDPVYRDRIAIFHFAGHAGAFHLCMESAEGKVELAHAGGLAAFLGLQAGLQLVFLNGCSTQQQTDQLLEARVGSVISTSQAINDTVAREFSIRFYQSLATGDGISTSFKEASAAVQLRRGGDLRSLFWEEAEEVADRFPWDFYVKDGAEIIQEWNLPDASGNPLFGLPELPEQPLPPDPYRYLQWFRPADAEIFFGRDYQIRALHDKIQAPKGSPIIHLFGRSGVGKSSLLAAGLTPRLQREYQVKYIRRSQILGLSDSLLEGIEATDRQGKIDKWLESEKGNKPLIVILDQTEEVFTRPHANKKEELKEFLGFIETFFFSGKYHPKGKLILAYRKEYLAEIADAFKTAQIPYQQVFLEKLKRNDIIAAVQGISKSTRTKAHYGLSIAPPTPGNLPLPQQIADDLLQDPDSPIAPVLQILLSNLWREAKSESPDQPSFNQDTYLTLKRRGLWMHDFLQNQLTILRQKFSIETKLGLILDVLAFHVTAAGTATSRKHNDLLAQYPHQADKIEKLLSALKDHYLLIDPKQDGTSTRLAHDTLAPMVSQRFNESTAPGQQALRTLRSRLTLNNDPDQLRHLDGPDVTLIEQGVKGMRTLSEPENHLLLSSKALLTEVNDPTRRLQMAKDSFQLKEDRLSREALISAFHQGIFYHKWNEEDFVQMIYLDDSTLFGVKEDNRGGMYDSQGNQITEMGFSNAITQAIASSDKDHFAMIDERDHVLIGHRSGKILADIQVIEKKTAKGRYQRGKLRRILNNQGNVLDVNFVASASQLCVITRNEGLKFYDLKGTLLKQEKSAFENIQLAKILPEQNQMVALLEGQGDLMLSNLGERVLKKLGKIEGDASQIIISVDGKKVAVVDNNILHVSDTDFENISPQTFQSEIVRATFISSHDSMIVGFVDDTCHWVNTMSNTDVILSGHDGKVEHLFINPSETAISMLSEGRVFTWKPGESGFKFKEYLKWAVRKIIPFPDQPEAAYMSMGSRVYSQGTKTISTTGPVITHENTVREIALSPDGQWLASVGADAHVQLIPTNDLTKGKTFKGITRSELLEKVENILYGPDGEKFSKQLTSSPKKLMDELTRGVDGHWSEVNSVDFSPDGKRFISGAADGTLKGWDLNGKLWFHVQGVVMWNELQDILRTGKDRIMQQQQNPVQEMLISNMPAFEAMSSKQLIQPNQDALTSSITVVRFHSDGKKILSAGSDGKIRIWDLKGKAIQTIDVSTSGILAAEFHEKEDWIIVGDAAGTLSLWKTDGTKIWSNQMHRKGITAISLSPNGQFATGSRDGRIGIWDWEGQCLALWEAQPSAVYTVAFAGKSGYLWSAGQDKEMRKWLVDVGTILGKFS